MENRPEQIKDNQCKLDAIKGAETRFKGKTKTMASQTSGRLLIILAYLFGGGGLMLWGVYLYLGPFHLVDLNLGKSTDFLINTLLCLVFFVQHSVMVRQGFRIFLTRFMPSAYHGVVYAISSGMALMMLVIFWQPSDRFLVHLPFFYYGAILLIIAFSSAGFFWSIRALSGFDALGIKPLSRHMKGDTPPEPMAFVVKGPYLFVRHPLYFLSLLIIWAGPVTSFDRILHNILWTIWIYFGAMLEEKDLVNCFGEPYKKYQADVPMLIPDIFNWKKS